MHARTPCRPQYFITRGVFYPTFTPAYWIGLRSNKTAWPRFDWMSYAVPPPDADNYEHWGVGDLWREPDNRLGGEFCGAANYTEIYTDAWGWADYNCTTPLPFMCRQDGAPPRCNTLCRVAAPLPEERAWVRQLARVQTRRRA